MYVHAERYRMNNQQVKAFMQAFTNRIILIQGPPGTGKTETAAWIIDAFASLNKNILLTSGSNAAIDNVARKLDDKVLRKVARYLADTAEEKVDQSVRDLYKGGLYPKQAAEEVDKTYNYSKQYFKRVKKECLKQLEMKEIFS